MIYILLPERATAYLAGTVIWVCPSAMRDSHYRLIEISYF